jgi:hypothetical protein
MDRKEELIAVSKELDLVLLNEDYLAARQIIADKISELLSTNFQKLVSILYRVDVDEAKLRSLLKQNPEIDAGLLIADMLIERQAQKIKSRQEYRRDATSSDEESW